MTILNMGLYLQNKLLGATLCSSTFTSPTTIYIALFTALDTTQFGSVVTEVSTPLGYTRQLVTFGVPSGTAYNTKNNLAATYGAANTPWGGIQYVGLYDTIAGGNLLYWAPLTTVRTITTADVFQVPTNNLVVTMD